MRGQVCIGFTGVIWLMLTVAAMSESATPNEARPPPASPNTLSPPQQPPQQPEPPPPPAVLAISAAIPMSVEEPKGEKKAESGGPASPAPPLQPAVEAEYKLVKRSNSFLLYTKGGEPPEVMGHYTLFAKCVHLLLLLLLVVLLLLLLLVLLPLLLCAIPDPSDSFRLCVVWW